MVVKKIEFQDVIAYLYEKRFVCTTSTTISFKSSKDCRIVCSLLLTRQGMIMVRSIPISLCSKVQAWYLEYLTEQCLVSQYIKELGSVNAMLVRGLSLKVSTAKNQSLMKWVTQSKRQRKRREHERRISESDKVHGYLSRKKAFNKSFSKNNYFNQCRDNSDT